MSDDYGLLDNYEGGPYCPHCECEMEWDDCGLCGGDGEFDWETLQFEDPLWYQPDDVETCEQCGGAGGWHWCSNPSCPAKQDTPRVSSNGSASAPAQKEETQV